AEEAITELLPTKSRKVYEKSYEDLVTWCRAWCNLKKVLDEMNENVFLAYFNEKSKTVRASTIWANYSMLKSMVIIKNNIDISQYSKLKAFLKRKNDGYKPKKSKVLTVEQVDQFLSQAPDDQFLMVKVALIVGVAGACRGNELLQLSINDVTDLGSSILVNINNTKNNIDRTFLIKNAPKNPIDFIQVYRKYMTTKNTSHSRFLVQYKHGRCTTQPIGKNTFGKLPQTIATPLIPKGLKVPLQSLK
ncbi:hypothetical protein NQ315_003587, partial [Exocentrus adspersus]